MSQGEGRGDPPAESTIPPSSDRGGLADSVAKFIEEFQRDPEGALTIQEHRAALYYFLARYRRLSPQLLRSLESLFTESPALTARSPKVAAWRRDFGLPESEEMRIETGVTLVAWTQAPHLAGRAWNFEACNLFFRQMREGRRGEPRRKWARTSSGDVHFSAPGPTTRETIAQAKARVVKAFEAALAESVKGWEHMEVFYKALGAHRRIIRDFSKSRRHHLTLLAQYQATPELSMKKLAKREEVTEAAIRYRLHHAADLIGLSYDRFRHASGSPKK